MIASAPVCVTNSRPASPPETATTPCRVSTPDGNGMASISERSLSSGIGEGVMGNGEIRGEGLAPVATGDSKESPSPLTSSSPAQPTAVTITRIKASAAGRGRYKQRAVAPMAIVLHPASLLLVRAWRSEDGVSGPTYVAETRQIPQLNTLRTPVLEACIAVCIVDNEMPRAVIWDDIPHLPRHADAKPQVGWSAGSSKTADDIQALAGVHRDQLHVVDSVGLSRTRIARDQPEKGYGP